MKTLKKLALGVLAVCMLAAFCACGNTGDTTPSDAPATQEVENTDAPATQDVENTDAPADEDTESTDAPTASDEGTADEGGTQE